MCSGQIGQVIEIDRVRQVAEICCSLFIFCLYVCHFHHLTGILAKLFVPLL